MLGPSFMKKKQSQYGQTGAQTASEGAERLGKFGSAIKEKKSDPVSAIQEYAKKQQEEDARKKKEAEEKKKQPVSPSSGFMSRIYDYFYPKKKE